jgi:lysophospholipase L1-like esterase
MQSDIISLVLGVTLLAVPTAHAQTHTPKLKPGAKYVAMGSSFAAGPGIPVVGPTCGSSDHNYAHLVAAALHLDLTDVSCSGATTDYILSTSQGAAALQINAVTPDTVLVTMTIGGNDIGFTRWTGFCSGKAADEHCAANLDRDSISKAVDLLPGKLTATVDAIRARAPNAIVVIVTYPRVFPEDSATCTELAMSAEDSAFLRALGQSLEDAFVRVAAERRTLIADAYVLAKNHGPCAASGRWVNGNTVAQSGARYHPPAEAHIEMARLVREALGRK